MGGMCRWRRLRQREPRLQLQSASASLQATPDHTAGAMPPMPPMPTAAQPQPGRRRPALHLLVCCLPASAARPHLQRVHQLLPLGLADAPLKVARLLVVAWGGRKGGSGSGPGPGPGSVGRVPGLGPSKAGAWHGRAHGPQANRAAPQRSSCTPPNAQPPCPLPTLQARVHQARRPLAKRGGQVLPRLLRQRHLRRAGMCNAGGVTRRCAGIGAAQARLQRSCNCASYRVLPFIICRTTASQALARALHGGRAPMPGRA